MDEHRESLPLILDEVLVHWDAERRAALYPLLAKVAERRQVILLTCHAHLAEEHRHALKGRVIELGTRSVEIDAGPFSKRG